MIGSDDLIIAEVASAHNGSVHDLIQIVQLSFESNFNAVKIQIYRVAELLTQDKISESRLLANELSDDDWLYFFTWWNEFQLKSNSKYTLIVEPFGHLALDLVFKLVPNQVFFKLPTSDFFDRKFLSRLLVQCEVLYLGIGGSTDTEIISTLEFIRSSEQSCVIKLLHGFQGFPTQYIDGELWKIQHLKNLLCCEVGYACHSDSHDSIPQILSSAVAIGAGASFIEKHVNLDRSKRLSDHSSALDPSEFKDFVDYARLAFDMLSRHNVDSQTGFSWLSDNERKYRESMKKYACASRPLFAGVILAASDIAFKRTKNGSFSQLDLFQIVGKVLLSDIAYDQPFSSSHITL